MASLYVQSIATQPAKWLRARSARKPVKLEFLKIYMSLFLDEVDAGGPYGAWSAQDVKFIDRAYAIIGDGAVSVRSLWRA